LKSSSGGLLLVSQRDDLSAGIVRTFKADDDRDLNLFHSPTTTAYMGAAPQKVGRPHEALTSQRTKSS
jgi:hypothetical protein